MIEIHEHAQGIRELRLARPPVNALDAALIAALRSAIAQAPADGAQGLIVSGRSGLFSAGLDIPALLALDAAALTRCFEDFFGLLAALAASPIPVAAAITGQSPAGGAVLALFCDWRVMARGSYRIGLNEVQVGLAVPDGIQHLLRRLVGPRRAERLMVAGAMIPARRAFAIGMVDELADLPQVLPTAIGWLSALLALPSSPMLRTRALARADVIDALENHIHLDGFIDAWDEPDTQETLKALVAKLRK